MDDHFHDRLHVGQRPFGCDVDVEYRQIAEDEDLSSRCRTSRVTTAARINPSGNIFMWRFRGLIRLRYRSSFWRLWYRSKAPDKLKRM